MKINTLTFKELDRKWFCIEDKNQIKKICKKLWLDKTDKPLLIYSFIEYNEGFKFRILGNIYFDKEFEINDEFIECEEILDYDFCKNFDVIKIDEDIIKNFKNLKNIETQINKYYSNNDINKIREMENIDKFRDKEIIDKVKFLLINKETKQENVNGLIVGLDENNDIICKVLDKPKKIFKLKKNSLIVLKYLDRPKFKGLVFYKKYTRPKK